MTIPEVTSLLYSKAISMSAFIVDKVQKKANRPRPDEDRFLLTSLDGKQKWEVIVQELTE